jgi:hypothetical protein
VNEIGRLAQGLKDTANQGTNMIHFIKHMDLPKGCTATYIHIIVDVHPQKAEPNQVTVGGNLIGKVNTPTNMTTAKLVFNSVLPTPQVKFTCYDISNLYLNTPIQ